MAKEFKTGVVIGGKISPTMKKAFDLTAKYAKTTSDSITKANKIASESAEKLGKKIDNVKSIAKKAAVAGGILGGAAVIASKQMLEQAAGMEQYRSTLNVVMKDQEKAAKIMGWAVDYANRTPFDTDQVVDATVKLQSYSLEAQKVLPLIGDMAGVMGKDLDQAVEAVANAQTGELKSLKRFGITKQHIVEHANKVMKGIDVVNKKGQITNQRAFNIAMFSLMKERFEGGMDIQSKTYKGVMSTIGGLKQNILAQIAGITPEGDIVEGSFFEVFKDKAEQLVDLMMKMQEDGTVDKLRVKLTDLTTQAVDGVEKLIPKVVDFTEKVISNGPKIAKTAVTIGKAFLTWKAISFANNVIQTMGQLGGAIGIVWKRYIPLLGAKAKDIVSTLYLRGLYAKDTIVMAAKTAAIWAQTVAQNALNIAMKIGTLMGKGFGAVMTFLTSPIGLVVIAVAGLIAGLYLLYKNWDKVSQFLVTSWQSYVVPFFQGISSWFSGIFEGISGTFKGFVNFIIGGINKLIDGLNMINFKVPDWVPKFRGQTFGVNIAKIPTFAKGGIAARPSIFGEAGPEMAIPLKPKSPRSISLLQQTAQILGVGPQGGGGNAFIYAPQIQGGNAAEIKPILEEDFERFKAWAKQFNHDERRLSFNG